MVKMMSRYHETTLLSRLAIESLLSNARKTEHMQPAKRKTTNAVPLDEFMKSGGSAKCLPLALD
ncbi:MAG: hypothetical protein OEY63_04185 [Gemmatimonadota bacterium]|nr:hypothetical protein [Gemmatimonadota bacterium]